MKKTIITIVITAIIVAVICSAIFYFINNPKENNIKNEIEEEIYNNSEIEEVDITDNSEIAGTIEISKINMHSDIYASATANNLKLGIAILYSESDGKLNTKNNTILIGMGSGEGTLLNEADKLTIDDKIIIKDYSTNSIVNYEIYDIFYTTARDTTFYKKDSEGKREIIITTNNFKSNARVKKENNSKLLKERLIICAREVQ